MGWYLGIFFLLLGGERLSVLEMMMMVLSSVSPPPYPSLLRGLTFHCYPSVTTSSLSSPSTTNLPGGLKPILVRGDPPTFVSAPGRRIVAVGDLHGDLVQARHALQLAGVLSSDGLDSWTGNQTVVVQLGDVLDRGENEIAILSLLRSLDEQAKVEGGAVFQVNGNHETMNIEGDYRYADAGAFDECAGFLDYMGEYGYDWEEAFINWITVAEKWKEDHKMPQSYWDPWNLVKRQKGVVARSVLLQPGGPLASELAKHGVVLKINDWVFCHGGLFPHHVAYGIERINAEVSRWMRGRSESESGPRIPFIALRGYDSVVWNRLYSRDNSDFQPYKTSQIQSILEETLQALGAKAMVVGHTPQTIGINCKYRCSVWRIDVGMSSGVLNSRPEVLEIVDDKAIAIRGRRDAFSELQMTNLDGMIEILVRMPRLELSSNLLSQGSREMGILERRTKAWRSQLYPISPVKREPDPK